MTLGRIAWGLFALSILVSVLATPTVLARRELAPMVMLWGPLVLTGLMYAYLRSQNGMPRRERYEMREAGILGLVLIALLMLDGAFLALALDLNRYARPYIVVFCGLWIVMGSLLRGSAGPVPPEERVIALVARHWRWGYFGLTGAALLTAMIAKDPGDAILPLTALSFFISGTFGTHSEKRAE